MKKISILFILWSASSTLSAQQGKVEEIAGAKVGFTSKTTGLPSYVSIENGYHVSGEAFPEWMKEHFTGNEDTYFQKYKSESDQLGMTHSRYYQYYKGYRIEGSMVMAHQKNQQLVSFSGEWYKDIVPANQVSLSEKEALGYALNKVNAKRYKWENKAEEASMREALGNPNFSYKPTGTLVLVPSVEKQGIVYRYAYKFDIYAELPVSRKYMYVDASTGAVIREQAILCTANAVGTANTKYSGTQTMTTDSYAGGYRLRETGRGNGIETYNLNNSGTYSNTDFTNATNTWTSTGTNQTGTDAHWGAEKTYDFYYNTFNRNSIDNAGFKLLSYVHANLVAMGFPDNVNAFWDGQRMTYGDGDISAGYTIMTALDVCGHEITHGVVENSANLGNGEAGALNEAFADIFGTSVEWYARPSQHDWIIGKDITTSGIGLRNMSNPNQLQQPDTYQGTYWDAGGEVHTNNGPCIYWFYLLSVGGSGTNDNSQTYNVSAITMAKAEAIAYRALTVYMTPSTTYADVRNYTIQAAKDLYGSCSNEVIQTTNAWYAVGVGSQYTTPSISPAFTSNILTSCSLPLTVQFNNTTNSGSAYTWYFGDGTTSNSVTPAHTYTANGTYTVKLKVIGCTGTTSDSLTRTSYITVNSPSAPTSPGASVCSGNAATLTATGSGTIKWYDAPTGGTLLNTGNSYTTPSLTTTTTYYAVSNTTVAPVFGGPATNTAFGSGSYFTVTGTDHYQTFDVLQPCTLKTVVVYSGAAGNRIIQLRNSASAVITSTTVNLASGTQTVTLNFPLTPGSNYQLNLSGSSPVTNLYRNSSGSGYPYNINSLLTITGNDVGSNYYYFFYNWQVQGQGCQSAPVAVTATVGAGSGLTVNSPSLCAGSTVTLTASGASTYTWSGGPNTASYAVSPSATTIYTVSGTTSGGCVNTNTTQVTVSSLPSTSVLSASICAGATATLIASGANTYSWNTGANGANLTVSPSSTTVYTVTGTSAAGCVKTATGSVVVGSSPAISLSSTSVCAGSPAVLSASGVTTYTWSSGPNTASYTVTPSATTVYTVSGNLTGCAVTATATATVTVNSLPVVSAGSATVCAGNTASLSATGAASYAWSNGSTSASINVNPSISTVYTFTGTTAAGCSAAGTASVTVNALPVVSVNSATVCSGSGATLTASGAVSYSWDTGASGSTISVSPASSTVYTVTGTSAASCVNTATAGVTVTSSPVISASSPSICSGSSVVLTAGGVSTYTWTSGPNTPTYTVTPSATTVYTVSGNLAGCATTAVKTVTVTVNPLPTVSLASAVDTACVNNTAVNLLGTPAGGSYSGTAVSGNSFNPSLAGQGSFTVSYSYTDSHGCSNSASKPVTVLLCTGIGELSANGILIYPNPATDVLTIQLPAEPSQATSVEVYDAIGKLIMKEQLKDGTTSLRIGSLAGGVYQLRLIAEGYAPLVKKIVKE